MVSQEKVYLLAPKLGFYMINYTASSAPRKEHNPWNLYKQNGLPKYVLDKEINWIIYQVWKEH